MAPKHGALGCCPPPASRASRLRTRHTRQPRGWGGTARSAALAIGNRSALRRRSRRSGRRCPTTPHCASIRYVRSTSASRIGSPPLVVRLAGKLRARQSTPHAFSSPPSHQLQRRRPSASNDAAPSRTPSREARVTRCTARTRILVPRPAELFRRWDWLLSRRAGACVLLSFEHATISPSTPRRRDADDVAGPGRSAHLAHLQFVSSGMPIKHPLSEQH